MTPPASSAYDFDCADLDELMEFHANNPDAPNKPVDVITVYNVTPASVLGRASRNSNGNLLYFRVNSLVAKVKYAQLVSYLIAN